MKTFLKLLFVGIFSTIVLFSCSRISGDKFLGTWHNKYGQKELVISKANDTAYKVLVHDLVSEKPNRPTVATHMTIFQEGNLIDKHFFILSYWNGKLILEGKEYEKAPDADPTQIEKEETYSNRIYNEYKRIADSIRTADSLAMVQAAEYQKKANGK
jgi:hypothetical protein